MKVSDVIKKVVGTSGSHRHFTHPDKPGIVTISGNTHAEMPKGTLSNVLKQAGLK